MKPEPDRTAALIVQNKALLLVTGHDEQIYWTPGGKMDEGEDKLQTLKRELDEELSVIPESAEPYTEIRSASHVTGKPRTTYYYLVTINKEPQPSSEIQGLHWYTKADFERRKPTVMRGITNVLVPKLIADGLM